MLPNRWSDEEAAFYKALGRSLRRARLAAGLGLSEFARKVGYSKQGVTNIEAGRSAPSLYRLTFIMTALGPHAHDVAIPGLVPADVSAVECCEQEALEPEGAGHGPECLRRAG